MKPDQPDCPDCQGTGIGYHGPDSNCSTCRGSGIRPPKNYVDDVDDSIPDDYDLQDDCPLYYDGK